MLSKSTCHGSAPRKILPVCRSQKKSSLKFQQPKNCASFRAKIFSRNRCSAVIKVRSSWRSRCTIRRSSFPKNSHFLRRKKLFSSRNAAVSILKHLGFSSWEIVAWPKNKCFGIEPRNTFNASFRPN